MRTAQTPGGSGSTPGIAGRVARRALVATVTLGVVLAVTGGLVAGSSALAGVLVGVALVCSFFGLGAVVLIWVTRVSPAASLLVGLMTYTLQVVLVGVAFAVLQASGLMESSIDGNWLGATVIAGTVVWLAIQVTTTFRTRQLYYDLPSEGLSQDRSPGPGPGSEGRSAGGPGATEAGAR